MKSKIQLRLLILALTAVGLGLAIHKYLEVGYPFIPRQQIAIWTIEAKVSFRATGGPVKVKLAVPGEQPTLGILDEIGTSLDYGFTPPGAQNEKTGFYRTVTWSREEARRGRQELFYRVDVYKRPSSMDFDVLPPPAVLDPSYMEEPLSVAADQVVSQAKRYSADGVTFMGQLIQLLGDSTNQNVQYLLEGAKSDLAKSRLLLNLALKAGYNAHLIRALVLGESSSSQSLVPGVLILGDDGQGDLFAWGNPQPVEDGDILAWQRGGPALIELRGGRDARVEFAVMKRQLPATFVLEQASEQQSGSWVNFSLSQLSIEQQNSYRLLLMIPLGALVVVIMRNLVGIKTSGTFMPILLAMAFLKTTLLSGLILFVIVVSAGLIMRSYLSRLDLLLVPRISAVVVVVIGIMVGFGLIGSRFNLAIASSVTLFPTIILAWTVERLSVLWEEDGLHEVAVQAAGSLVVAILAYFVMGNGTLRYLVFIFPELLLVVLAGILGLGQYAGYRLTELIRFSPLAESQAAKEDG